MSKIFGAVRHERRIENEMCDIYISFSVFLPASRSKGLDFIILKSR
jgi:hypothetical protein